MTVGIYCLSVHASYTCRRSGACCRAGWDISIEPEAVAQVGDEPEGRHGELVNS
jgi:hypothetical protein